MDKTIKQYQKQLEQVDQTLKISTDETEKKNLRSLQRDLQELLDLTIQTENSLTKGNDNSDHFDSEMELFLSEINNIEGSNDGIGTVEAAAEKNLHLEGNLESIKEELKLMIGQKCSAPHQHTWGSTSYHNAIICGVDDTEDYEHHDINNFRLKVLFTNPTHREMIPCSYFLDGECRFDEDRCHFSHGELVPFGNLQEYKEPNFSELEKNCIVLAKMNDKLWHKGRVVEADFDKKLCKIRLENQKRKELDFEFENLFPIFQGDGLSSDSSYSDDSSNSGNEDLVANKRARLIEQSLLNPSKNQVLGEWEKHTKGIGSKLMSKMGYIVGTGLGSNGDGIILPISAQILPPGKSLDHCMELREAANGDENLFNVERKMKKAQKRQEALSAKHYERERNKSDVFSFLNGSILNGTTESKDLLKNKKQQNIESKTKKYEKISYKQETTKNLNVESVRIADDIKKANKEIIKIKESLNRHANGTEVHDKLKKILDLKNLEITNLKNRENLLAKEQLSRKDQHKLSIF